MILLIKVLVGLGGLPPDRVPSENVNTVSVEATLGDNFSLGGQSVSAIDKGTIDPFEIWKESVLARFYLSDLVAGFLLFGSFWGTRRRLSDLLVPTK